MNASIPPAAQKSPQDPRAPSAPRGPHDVPMVEFRGLLPAQPAGFLSRLQEHERRDVYALLGTFKEVRGLVGAGRLLHQVLLEGPLAAARGRISFRDFAREKTEILQSILALRQRINRAAEDVCLVLPRLPIVRKESAAHG